MTPAEREARLQVLCRELLTLVDPEPERPGLADTPRRWASWWMERLQPAAGAARMDTTFGAEVTAQVTDQLVLVTGMRVWSLCEHHLLPFYCDVAVGYVATERVLGLSKFARIAHHHAAKLQVQERLVQDIRSHVVRVTGTEDVGVVARGEHLCMTMRGVRTPALMTSSALGGTFRANAAARAELLQLVAASWPTAGR
jgi:GTP cyclohydrolase I